MWSGIKCYHVFTGGEVIYLCTRFHLCIFVRLKVPGGLPFWISGKAKMFMGNKAKEKPSSLNFYLPFKLARVFI